MYSALLTPIYKKKGDPEFPTNNRPVCLTNAFKRLITTTLTIKLRPLQSSNLMQWGFQDGSNTEYAIAFSITTLRRRFPHAALLDLAKAYDCVPRDILQRLMDEKLPSELSTMVRPLLWPMKLQTKNQRSDDSVRTVAGMPQSDLQARSCSQSSWTSTSDTEIQPHPRAFRPCLQTTS